MSMTEFERILRDREKTSGYQTEKIILEITEKICMLMEREKIDRAELARRLGTSRAYITKVLNGNSNLTVESLVKISMALNDLVEINFPSLRYNCSITAEMNKNWEVKWDHKFFDLSEICEPLIYKSEHFCKFNFIESKEISSIQTQEESKDAFMFAA